jgi:hypothetical protein
MLLNSDHLCPLGPTIFLPDHSVFVLSLLVAYANISCSGELSLGRPVVSL